MALPRGEGGVSRTTHRERSVTVLGMKRRLAMLSTAACAVVFGAALGCGVQEGQDQIEKARQVQKQAEDSQHKLEKQLQDGQENLDESR